MWTHAKRTVSRGPQDATFGGRGRTRGSVGGVKDAVTTPVPARAADLAAVLALVEASGLPVDGIAERFPDGYAVAHEPGGRLAGVAGLEIHGAAGLLRSVAVAPAFRGNGLGRRLVDDRLAAATTARLDAVYLLTTSAAEIFRRLGFADARREDAPEEMRRSPEFASLCPSSAQCLVRALR